MNENKEFRSLCASLVLMMCNKPFNSIEELKQYGREVIDFIDSNKILKFIKNIN